MRSRVSRWTMQLEEAAAVASFGRMHARRTLGAVLMLLVLVTCYVPSTGVARAIVATEEAEPPAFVRPPANADHAPAPPPPPEPEPAPAPPPEPAPPPPPPDPDPAPQPEPAPEPEPNAPPEPAPTDGPPTDSPTTPPPPTDDPGTEVTDSPLPEPRPIDDPPPGEGPDEPATAPEPPPAVDVPTDEPTIGETEPAIPQAPGPNPALQVGDYQQVIALVFPTLGQAVLISGYHHPRDGGRRVHMASDLMGEKHWPLFATVSGTICRIGGLTGGEPAAGYHLTICGDDGRRHRYLHLNNDNPGTDDGLGGPSHAFAPGIAQGVRVTAGQHVGYMGDSGNAENTPPHLHLDIFDDRVRDPYGQPRIDPYPSLLAAQGRAPSWAGVIPSAPATADTGEAVEGDVDTATDDAPDPDVVPEVGDPAEDAPAADPSPSDITRIAGPDRVATSIAATSLWSTVDTLVIAGADDQVEGEIAGQLAARLGAPLVLTAPGALDQRVASAIAQLGVGELVLVGAVAQLEVEGVSTTPPQIHRLEGSGGATLDAVVAEHLRDHDGLLTAEGPVDAPSAVLLVSAESWSDQAIAVAAAARRQGVVVAIYPLEWSPEHLRAGELAGLPIIIIGGEAAMLSPAGELAPLVRSDGQRSPRRRPTRGGTGR